MRKLLQQRRLEAQGEKHNILQLKGNIEIRGQIRLIKDVPRGVCVCVPPEISWVRVRLPTHVTLHWDVTFGDSVGYSQSPHQWVEGVSLLCHLWKCWNVWIWSTIKHRKNFTLYVFNSGNKKKVFWRRMRQPCNASNHDVIYASKKSWLYTIYTTIYKTSIMKWFSTFFSRLFFCSSKSMMSHMRSIFLWEKPNCKNCCFVSVGL